MGTLYGFLFISGADRSIPNNEVLRFSVKKASALLSWEKEIADVKKKASKAEESVGSSLEPALALLSWQRRECT